MAKHLQVFKMIPNLFSKKPIPEISSEIEDAIKTLYNKDKEKYLRNVFSPGTIILITPDSWVQ